ncbi:MAG TPA: hypothetical protein VMU84_16040 [Thermoanaerobaculia bacterium]|nr:hypothetical protein [Thermoanaerobaculia bacterium]
MTFLGIVLPSLAVTFAVRRWIAPVSWRMTALFLVLTLAFLHGAVFMSKLPVPVDEVARGYPYRGVLGDVVAKNPLTNDTARLFLPWMQVAREELFHFRAPLWNRYSFSGYPLLGNGESAPFSPIFLATLFVPLPKQIVAMAGLKIFLALLFGFLFMKREGASDAAAVLASSAFAFSVFQTVYLYYSTTAVTALLPAALFALFFALDRANRSGVVFVAIIVATLMANGHPESVLHIAIAAAVLMAIDLAFATDKRDWMRRFRFPLAGAIAGLALSAPAWVPVLEQVFRSTRYADLHRAAHVLTYPLTMLWAMAMPAGFGHPARHNWSWVLNYSVVASSYLGALVTVLVATAAVSRRTSNRDRVLIGAALVLWLIAMNWTPLGHALNQIPPFSFTANDKLRFVALFIAAVVAARVADRIKVAEGIAVLVFGAVFAGVAVYAWRTQVRLVQPLDLAGAALAIGFGVLLLVPRFRSWAAVLAAAYTIAELFILNASFNSLVEAKYYRPELPIIEALRRAAPKEPFRVAAFDWMFLPNASALYGLEDIRGSDPMSFDGYTELLKKITIDDPSIDVDRIGNVDDPLLDGLNVRFLLAEPDAKFSGRWKQIYAGRDGVLFENTRARPRFWAENAVVRIDSATPARITLRIETPAPVAISSSQIASGWRVKINGRAVAANRINDVFLAFTAPSGVSTAEVVYAPWSFYAMVPVSLLAVFVLCFQNRGIALWGRALARVPTGKFRVFENRR